MIYDEKAFFHFSGARRRNQWQTESGAEEGMNNHDGDDQVGRNYPRELISKEKGSRKKLHGCK